MTFETGMVSPEQALLAIRGFSGARIRSRLSNGPTNASYLVERLGDQYVLRLDKPEAARLGLDRALERRVAEIAAAAGLGPEPLFFNHESGICLRRFIPGRAWSESDLAKRVNLERLAGVLRTLHDLPAQVSDFDPLAAVRRYTEQVDTPEARRICKRAERLGSLIDSARQQPALCHNDLVCDNIVATAGEKLMLIDWEYAGAGDPFFDLAVVVQHHRLREDLSHYFLEAYLGHSASGEDRDRLSLHCRFYRCLLDLWNLRISL